MDGLGGTPPCPGVAIHYSLRMTSKRLLISACVISNRSIGLRRLMQLGHHWRLMETILLSLCINNRRQWRHKSLAKDQSRGVMFSLSNTLRGVDPTRIYPSCTIQEGPLPKFLSEKSHLDQEVPQSSG